MPKLGWYKRDPAKFLAATMGWTAEQKGIYSSLLDLMYDRGAPLLDEGDEAGKLARIVGVSTYRFKQERDRLLGLGKLFRVPNGRLSNDRFEREMKALAGKDGQKDGSFQPETPKKNTDKKPDLLPSFPDGTRQANDLTPPPLARAHDSPARIQNSETSSNQSHTGEQNPLQKTVESKLARVCKILNVRLESDISRMNWPRQLLEMEQAGLDFELDILPTIEAHKGERANIRSLKYFLSASTERRDARKTASKVGALMDETLAADVGALSDEQWARALVSLGQSGIWHEERYGPPPTRPGCLAPPAFIARFLEVWTAQGSHPLQELDASDTMVDYPADRPDLERRARWMP